MIKKALVTALMLTLPVFAWADWQLDNDFSRVNFVSVKKNMIGETHHFKQVDGALTDQGQLTVNIGLASVETMIPIRNQRMQKFLFETELFPHAKISAKVDPIHFALKPGQSKIVLVKANVALHGSEKMIESQVMISRLSEDKLLVSSLNPIIIRPADFGLDKGVDKLMALAKLPGITQSVPVSFVLTFTQ